MRRLTLAICAALAVSLFWCPPGLLRAASAQEDNQTNLDTTDDSFETKKRKQGSDNWTGNGASGDELWFRPGLGEDEEGTGCYVIEVDTEATEDASDAGGDPNENTSWVDSDEFLDRMTDGGLAGGVNDILTNIGLGRFQIPEERCPGNDPDDLVEIVWRSELCPPPPPSPLNMDPDHTALTGMPGYLEIGGDNPATVTCLGEQIIATVRYVIHWGDGHTTETTSQGGAYPDGNVRHTYANSGDTEILVEAYWRGEWNGIDLGEIPTPTTDTLTVDVQEMQSVRTTSGG